MLSEEVHSESFSKYTKDSFHTTVNSHHEVNSRSASPNSRPSVASTSASGYDSLRDETDDASNNTGGDI